MRSSRAPTRQAPALLHQRTTWTPPPRSSSVPEQHHLVRQTVEPCVLWSLRGLQVHGFESSPRSECRLGFLTRGNGLLAGGL
ncbi:hypothetical protein E2C01_086909 [Portunus trituberculatus]|uniref:Uncharacterized protein n=1 Tax=Portunus trituberculatus TaxID=210409 RepID=A0A5B7JFW9_PORTR|nr:hypothetical protein [Portunus trituberculatus]